MKTFVSLVLAIFSFACPFAFAQAKPSKTPGESESISCKLALKNKDPELGFVPKSIQLHPISSADGNARWNLTLDFETYSSDESGKAVAIPQKEAALLEYSCLKKGCFAITRREEKEDHSRYLTLLYFKTFPATNKPRAFKADVVVVGRNPYAKFVDVPVELSASCKPIKPTSP